MDGFNSSDDDKLINLVSQYRFLYDTTLPMFRNAFKRIKAWDEIGKQINRNGVECKRRWRNIKDTYFKQKKKLYTGLSSGGHPRSKFENYKTKLSFLEEAIQYKFDNTKVFITMENNDENSHSTVGSEVQSSEDPGVIIIKEECNSDENDATEELRLEDPNTETDQWDFAGYKSSTETQERQSIEKKRMIQARKRKILLSKRKKVYNLQKLRNNQRLRQVEDEDEINLFTRQANSVLRKLPSYHQIKAMQEMFEILTKYKILAAESSSEYSYPKNSSNDPLMNG